MLCIDNKRTDESKDVIYRNTALSTELNSLPLLLGIVP